MRAKNMQQQQIRGDGLGQLNVPQLLPLRTWDRFRGSDAVLQRFNVLVVWVKLTIKKSCVCFLGKETAAAGETAFDRNAVHVVGEHEVLAFVCGSRVSFR